MATRSSSRPDSSPGGGRPTSRPRDASRRSAEQILGIGARRGSGGPAKGSNRPQSPLLLSGRMNEPHSIPQLSGGAYGRRPRSGVTSSSSQTSSAPRGNLPPAPASPRGLPKVVSSGSLHASESARPSDIEGSAPTRLAEDILGLAKRYAETEPGTSASGSDSYAAPAKDELAEGQDRPAKSGDAQAEGVAVDEGPAALLLRLSKQSADAIAEASIESIGEAGLAGLAKRYTQGRGAGLGDGGPAEENHEKEKDEKEKAETLKRKIVAAEAKVRQLDLVLNEKESKERNVKTRRSHASISRRVHPDFTDGGDKSSGDSTFMTSLPQDSAHGHLGEERALSRDESKRLRALLRGVTDTADISADERKRIRTLLGATEVAEIEAADVPFINPYAVDTVFSRRLTEIDSELGRLRESRESHQAAQATAVTVAAAEPEVAISDNGDTTLNPAATDHIV
eukprot:m.52316 g.52316  ORF g.52316 m.52316 type:complete len:454 (-) comp16516_c0_seq1:2192-3553(-)